MHLLDTLRARRRDKSAHARASLYISAPYVSERESSLYRPAHEAGLPSPSKRHSVWEFWRSENSARTRTGSPSISSRTSSLVSTDDDDANPYLDPAPLDYDTAYAYNPRRSTHHLARLSRELDATFANFSAVDLTARRREPIDTARHRLSSPSMGYLADAVPAMTPPVPPRSHLRAAPGPSKPAAHSPTPSHASSLVSFVSSAHSATAPTPSTPSSPSSPRTFGRARQSSASAASVSAATARDPHRVVGGPGVRASSSGVYTPPSFPGPLGARAPPLMSPRSRSVSSDSSCSSSLPQTPLPQTPSSPHASAFAPFASPSPSSGSGSRASFSMKDRTLASLRRISESLASHAPKDVTPVQWLPPVPAYAYVKTSAKSPTMSSLAAASSPASAYGLQTSPSLSTSPDPDVYPYEGKLASPLIPSPRAPTYASAYAPSPCSDYASTHASPASTYEPFEPGDRQRSASALSLGAGTDARGRRVSNPDERRARRKPVPQIDEAPAIEA
ncbi:hypothetical protein Q5752_003334 [Cryptotrichosporon argae]